jgi:hypothetical protein
MLLTYFLNDFEIVPVAPSITGISLALTFYMRCISIVRSLYFKIFFFFFFFLLLLLYEVAARCKANITTGPKEVDSTAWTD